MNIERDYVKFLLKQLDDMTKLELKNKYLERDYTEVCKDLSIKEELLSETQKELKKVKNNMKKAVKISNPQTFDIFNEIKCGNVITFITPTNKKYNSYDSNPFLFELDNMKAVFDGKLLGMCETKNGKNYWYHITNSRKHIASEIMNLLGVDKSFREECRIKPAKTKGKLAKSFKLNDILKLNPVVDELGRFVTINNVKFVYTHNDGSQFIIKADGTEEVI